MYANQSSWPDFTASLHELDGEFELVTDRLQHICIKQFACKISDNPFMRFWMGLQTEFEFGVNDLDFGKGNRLC